MKKLLPIFLSLILTACAMGSQTDLSRNQQKWQNAGISHYRFDLFISCFCPFGQDMPLIIEVENDQVVSMEFHSGNTINATDREYFERLATIERIFSEMQKDLNGEADEITVTYDSTYGFPEQVNIDYIKNAVDDELALTISGFEALP